jgi:hypothetical protein
VAGRLRDAFGDEDTVDIGIDRLRPEPGEQRRPVLVDADRVFLLVTDDELVGLDRGDRREPEVADDGCARRR